MKQFLPGIALCVAFVVGCLAATAAGDIAVPSARSANTGAVEYTCHRVRLSDLTQEGGPTDVLNKYGAQGWRLVPLDWGDHVCFERG